VHDQANQKDKHTGGERAEACGQQQAATSTDSYYDEHNFEAFKQDRLEGCKSRDPIELCSPTACLFP